MRRVALLAGSLLLLATSTASAKSLTACSGSLVWRGAGSYALSVRCARSAKQIRITPNAPLTVSAVKGPGCTRTHTGAVTCSRVHRLAATLGTPQDQACSLRVTISGKTIRTFTVLAVGCPTPLHFAVDYTGKASGIESADIFSTWTTSINWSVHFGDLALSLPAPASAQSATRNAGGTWQLNNDGCAGSVSDLDASPAKIYALADVTGTYRLLVEAALDLSNGGVISAGTSPLPCREWDGGPIGIRGSNQYPAGTPISYTASLQALISVKYATLANVSVGHSFTATLEGPDPSLQPTSGTGPKVQWAGQVVLTRTR